MVLPAHDSPSEQVCRGVPAPGAGAASALSAGGGGTGGSGGSGGAGENGNGALNGAGGPRAAMDRLALLADLGVIDAAGLMISERFEAVARALEDMRESPQGVRETHALRVATRRATAALTVFTPHLDPKRVKKAKRRLRVLRSAAGAVRACDVQEELLLAAEREPGHDESMAVAAELMLGRVQKWREAARRGLVAARERYRPGRARRTAERLIGTVHAALGRVDVASAAGDGVGVAAFRRSAGARTALEVARAGIGLARRRFEDASRAAAPMADFEALHEMRLAGKRLRYVIELMAPALDEESAESAVATLRKLQDRLGEINDRHELARRTESAARELGLREGGKTARAFAALRQALVASRDGLLDEFESWWCGPAGAGETDDGAGGGSGSGKAAKLGRALDRLMGLRAASPARGMGLGGRAASLDAALGEAIRSAEELMNQERQEAGA